jgi:hypothetical protein
LVGAPGRLDFDVDVGLEQSVKALASLLGEQVRRCAGCVAHDRGGRVCGRSVSTGLARRRPSPTALGLTADMLIDTDHSHAVEPGALVAVRLP